jgi:CRP-like cAMP-binding protein
VELTREDIASLVGTATETTIRLLSDLKSEGIIATRGKKIMILNEKALKAIAG